MSKESKMLFWELEHKIHMSSWWIDLYSQEMLCALVGTHDWFPKGWPGAQ